VGRPRRSFARARVRAVERAQRLPNGAPSQVPVQKDRIRRDAFESAEAGALVGEEHREVVAALRKLPHRQREALVLRFYLDMNEAEVAQTMRISRGSVKSATSRAVAALGLMLREGS
jgi:RNA polymerase sigma factor (sigma-70 family)